VHHKLVDDQTTTYTVERLQSMKADHEAWVRSKLSVFDSKKQQEDELWAGYIVEWQTRCSLDNWLAETSHLFAPIPEIRTEFLEELDQLRDWLLSRVWPESGFPIRKALENFRMVLNDLLLVKQQGDWDSHLMFANDSSRFGCIAVALISKG
jgi:hypothetical protein